MRFIGDVHGKYTRYGKLMKKYGGPSIQVGDMGVGFYTYGPGGEGIIPVANPPHDRMVKYNARFIRGNHDNPEVCKRHSQYIPDGHYEDDMFFCGGAGSIDRAMRTEGMSWWADEELSMNELNEIVDKVADLKPKIMVTHECPEFLAAMILHPKEKYDMPSITRQAFESIYHFHQPDLWIFGHWHKSFDYIHEGKTRFKCLNELEVFDI